MNYEYELIASIILIDYNFKEEIIFKVCLDEKSKVSPIWSAWASFSCFAQESILIVHQIRLLSSCKMCNFLTGNSAWISSQPPMLLLTATFSSLTFRDQKNGVRRSYRPLPQQRGLPAVTTSHPRPPRDSLPPPQCPRRHCSSLSCLHAHWSHQIRETCRY